MLRVLAAILCGVLAVVGLCDRETLIACGCDVQADNEY